jgi:hypothetical protein
MFRRNRGPRRFGAVATAAVATLALAACGSSSSGGASGESAQTLLKQTFSNHHPVKSGILGFNLTINATGSSALSSPITLQLGGPFQSRGTGKLPASKLTISVSALGEHGSLGVITTGTAGYVALDGANYQLPSSTMSQLESSFSGSASSSTGKASLSALGVHPLAWLKDPSVAGSDTVGGVQTTHIHAGLNVSALLSQLATLISKAGASSSATASLASALSPAELQKVSSAIKNASVDVWTGQSDKTLRKLTVAMTIAISGKTSTSLGGVSSLGVSFSLQFSQLNQPQTITAPANVQPYSQFEAKLESLLGGLGGLGGSLGGSTGSTGSGSSGSTGSGTVPSSGAAQKYTECIQKAAGDVGKMQKCAPLLQGG